MRRLIKSWWLAPWLVRTKTASCFCYTVERHLVFEVPLTHSDVHFFFIFFFLYLAHVRCHVCILHIPIRLDQSAPCLRDQSDPLHDPGSQNLQRACRKPSTSAHRLVTRTTDLQLLPRISHLSCRYDSIRRSFLLHTRRDAGVLSRAYSLDTEAPSKPRITRQERGLFKARAADSSRVGLWRNCGSSFTDGFIPT